MAVCQAQSASISHHNYSARPVSAHAATTPVNSRTRIDATTHLYERRQRLVQRLGVGNRHLSCPRNARRLQRHSERGGRGHRQELAAGQVGCPRHRHDERPWPAGRASWANRWRTDGKGGCEATDATLGGGSGQRRRHRSKECHDGTGDGTSYSVRRRGERSGDGTGNWRGRRCGLQRGSNGRTGQPTGQAMCVTAGGRQRQPAINRGSRGMHPSSTSPLSQMSSRHGHLRCKVALGMSCSGFRPKRAVEPTRLLH